MRLVAEVVIDAKHYLTYEQRAAIAVLIENALAGQLRPYFAQVEGVNVREVKRA